MSDKQCNSDLVPQPNEDSANRLEELSHLKQEVASKADANVQNAEKAQDLENTFSQPVREECPGPTAESGYIRNAYEELEYMEHRHVSQVLERRIAGVHSELRLLDRSMSQLADHVKAGTRTTEFCAIRMLSAQKEILNPLSETNTSQKTSVHLLQGIRVYQRQYLKDPIIANERLGKSDLEIQSDQSHNAPRKRCHNDILQSSVDCSSSQPKKHKEK
ncbi:uncharacterized protein LOC142143150 [Mixophyes fleayi]|uniref:uncharacterized protein LOC142143150 n=1 Tax=Mixophyes fleayi TaxID=3061075 RepID=UPI003F4E1AAF